MLSNSSARPAALFAFPRTVVATSVRSVLLLVLVSCSSAPLAPAAPQPAVGFASVAYEDSRSTFVRRSSKPSSETPRATIRAFFTALTHRSPAELSQVLADDALTFRPNHDPTSAVVGWMKRIGTVDYSTHDWAALLPVQVFDRTHAHELDTVRHFHLLPAIGEWLAVVELPQSHSPRLWGSQLQFILRPRDGSVQVTKIWEDYSP